MPPAKKSTKKTDAPAPVAATAKAAAKPPASKPATSKPAKQAAKPVAPAAPMIDASSAAAAAARMVKAGFGGSASGDASKPQSAAFKQLKDSVGKPGAASVAGFLHSTAPQKKNAGLPFGGANKQVGRNQTFGADVNRSGIPRRTGG